MSKVLIVGFGSIGKRHAEVFNQLGAAVAVVSGQAVDQYPVFENLGNALKEFEPAIILIANETNKHQATLELLAKENFKGSVFVEKPLANTPIILKHSFKHLFILYNLRMSPIIEMLKKSLANEKIISANIYCGQFLPSWRPNRDYRNVYSASKAQGGGALRDLSHDLDYSAWLLGDFKKVAAIGGHYSNLEIDSDDLFSILAQSEKCPVINITLNYLDRVAKRTITINTDSNTYNADLIKGELWKDSELLLSNLKTSDTYTIQAKNILEQKIENFCSVDFANSILKTIEASELSSIQNRFINL